MIFFTALCRDALQELRQCSWPPYCYRCPFNRARPECADALNSSGQCRLGMRWPKVEQKFAAQKEKRRTVLPAFVFEPLMQGADHDPITSPALIFNPALRPDALLIGVFHFAHRGHRVRQINNCRMCVAARQDDMHHVERRALFRIVVHIAKARRRYSPIRRPTNPVQCPQ